MNKKVDRISQILLWVVMIFLLLFLGTGIYFVIQGFVNPLMDTKTAGFVGIAIFLFGMGLVIILQASMMSESDTSFLKTFFMEEQSSGKRTGLKAVDIKPSMQFAVQVVIPERLIKSPKAATLYVCEDGLYIGDLSKTLIPVLYSMIKNVERSGEHLDIMYAQTLADGTVKDFNMGLDAENPLRLKAVENAVNKHIS